MITGVMRKRVPAYHPATVGDLRRPGGRRARNQPRHPREKQWEPERAAVWVPKQTQSTPISRGKEEGVGLQGHKPEDHKWSLPEKGGGPKDDVESPEGRHRRRRRRSKKTQEVQALSALGEAVGYESKGAIPKELPRRREKEDPFPRVEEETLAKLRELRFPRKEMNSRPPRAASLNRGRRERRGPGPLCWNCQLEGQDHHQYP